MFEGYFSMGGVEILNQHRVSSLLSDSGCDPHWIRCAPCPGLNDATGDNLADPTDAPWWDEDDEATHRFYGVYPISIEGLSDSTREAAMVEGILDGGVVSGYRRAIRQVRVRGLLIAEGEDALEAGMSWLDNALEPNSCSGHGAGCGEVDACWFVECPPEWPEYDNGFLIPEEDYEALVDPLWRRMHGVVTISGPLVEQEFKRQNSEWRARIVEFTIAATTPYVYGVQVALPLGGPQAPSVVADSPVNLIPYPSAEIGHGNTIVVATNWATNPSVETDATGWTAGSNGPNGATGARSTALAADGVASYLVTLNATNSGSSGSIFAYHEVDISSVPADSRLSFSIWAAGFVTSGSAIIESMVAEAVWRDASSDLSVATIGSTTNDFGGVAFSAKSLDIPSGAVAVRVRVTLNLTSWTSGDIVQLFTDACAVTTP